jgi:hypothetical protein
MKIGPPPTYLSDLPLLLSILPPLPPTEGFVDIDGCKETEGLPDGSADTEGITETEGAADGTILALPLLLSLITPGLAALEDDALVVEVVVVKTAAPKSTSPPKEASWTISSDMDMDIDMDVDVGLRSPCKSCKK